MGRKVTANLFPWTGGSQSQSPAPASNVRISDFSSLMGRAAKGPNQRLSVGDALRLTPYFGRRRLLQDAAPNVEALRGGKSEPGRRFNLAQAKNTMSFDHASVKIRVSKPQSPIVEKDGFAAKIVRARTSTAHGSTSTRPMAPTTAWLPLLRVRPSQRPTQPNV